VTGIDSILDGVRFTESGTVTSIAITALSAPTEVDCSSNSCIDLASPTIPASDWGVTLLGGTATAAGGGGALHPYGVVNDTVDQNVPAHGSGGLANGQHNPNFFGPFEIAFQTAGETTMPDITSFTFEFGSEPILTAGLPCTACGGALTSAGPSPIPEPSPVLLLAGGTLALAFAIRRRRG